MKFIKNNMKSIFFTFFAFCFFTVSFAQSHTFGSKFSFDVESEIDAQFVMKDNYNHYLITAVNKSGMAAKNQVILRKFDQQNNLVETITHPFHPANDISTLHTYHGAFEIGNEKVVVFSESYSGKKKISEIYKHVFDKKSGQFTTTLLVSNPILSLMKAGNVDVKKSENGAFIAINYRKHSAKKEPEVNNTTVLNGSNLEVVWQKEFTFTDEATTQRFLVTNSGKGIFVRNPNSYKLDNYLVLVSNDSQDNLTVGEAIKLHEPKAISIGSQDYLVAFNYPTKGIRRGDYGHIMLYDLSSGSILQNNKIEGFNSVAKINDVEYRAITLQNNEISIFVECKVEAGTKVATGFTASSFPETQYTYGPSSLITLGNDGVVKSVNTLLTSTTGVAPLYRSFGLGSAKGKTFIQTGLFRGFYELNTMMSDPKSPSYINFGNINDPERMSKVVYVNQLVHYFPDSNKYLFARIVNDTEMSLISVIPSF